MPNVIRVTKKKKKAMGFHSAVMREVPNVISSPQNISPLRAQNLKFYHWCLKFVSNITFFPHYLFEGANFLSLKKLVEWQMGMVVRWKVCLCSHLKWLCFSSSIEISLFTAADVVFALQNSLNMKQNAHKNGMQLNCSVLDSGQGRDCCSGFCSVESKSHSLGDRPDYF